jgi:hypothetical protein
MHINIPSDYKNCMSSISKAHLLFCLVLLFVRFYALFFTLYFLIFFFCYYLPISVRVELKRISEGYVFICVPFTEVQVGLRVS